MDGGGFDHVARRLGRATSRRQHLRGLVALLAVGGAGPVGGRVAAGGNVASGKKKPKCTVCAKGCKFKTIGAALAKAKRGSTVTVASGTYMEHDLLITVPLTLAACADTGDVTVNGGGEGRVLLIDPDPALADGSLPVVLRGVSPNSRLVLANGAATGANEGAGIRITARTRDVTMTLVTVTGNQASAYGGGIAMDGTGTLTLTDCNVTGNSATNGGGGILAKGRVLANGTTAISSNTINGDGAGCYVDGTTLTLAGSASVSGNTSTNGTGGGIFVATNSGLVMSDTATVTGNSAVTGGGVAASLNAELSPDVSCVPGKVIGNTSTANPACGANISRNGACTC